MLVPRGEIKYFRSILKDVIYSAVKGYYDDPLFVADLDENQALTDLFNGKVFTPQMVESYLTQFTKKTFGVKLNDDKHGVHFANGRFDLKQGEFGPRYNPFDNPGSPFITQCIDYPYTWDYDADEVKVKEREDFYNEINATLSNIFTEPDVLHYILYKIGKALVVDSHENAHCLYLAGEGAAERQHWLIA